MVNGNSGLCSFFISMDTNTGANRPLRETPSLFQFAQEEGKLNSVVFPGARNFFFTIYVMSPVPWIRQS